LYVKVRVTAGARREDIELVSNHHYRVSVREKPLENLANRRVTELVARQYGVAINKVRIVKGHRSPSKILAVEF
jgi:uncharacterized protein YggU (UPF0235/DUF167 family)